MRKKSQQDELALAVVAQRVVRVYVQESRRIRSEAEEALRQLTQELETYKAELLADALGQDVETAGWEFFDKGGLGSGEICLRQVPAPPEPKQEGEDG